MERLSIQSFLASGHPVHLYTYGALTGFPPGTTLRDGNEIIPESAIFRYRDSGGLSGFANHFRYKLLLDKGGWWTDLDIVCLQPLPEPEDYAFATEEPGKAGNCAMFSRPGLPVMEYLWEDVRRRSPQEIAWCETGPDLIRSTVARFGIERCLLPPAAFCPIPFARWFDSFVPGRAPRLGPETLGVHLWHEMWRRADLDKDEEYGPRSFYELMKRRFLS